MYHKYELFDIKTILDPEEPPLIKILNILTEHYRQVKELPSKCFCINSTTNEYQLPNHGIKYF